MIRFFASLSLVMSFAAFAAPAPAADEPVVAFGDGEQFKFKVAWGLFPGAGEIVISARAAQTEGLPQLQVATATATRGFIRGLYPFDGAAEFTFDAKDGRMLAARASTAAGKKKTHAMAVFDYRAATVHYEDFLRPQRSGVQPLPDGRPVDLMTCLVQTRFWDLKVGERRPVVVMFDDDFYALTVIAERYEKLNTPSGKTNALVLRAVMEKDPKGMFKRGGTVHVWISQDEKRLPVKLEVALPVGTGVARLIEYRPPTPAPRLADAHPRS